MSGQERRLRLFVAVELGPEVRAALGDLQRDLRGRGLERLRWTREEGIHLTLKFLGETPEERVPDIVEALERSVPGHRRHRLALARLGTFGGKSRPRVLWVDLDGEREALGALQASVESALAEIGFPAEDRRFSPHLTLARVRPETARDVAGPIARAIETVEVLRAIVPVEEVSLMQSRLGPGGAVYTRLAGVALDE